MNEIAANGPRLRPMPDLAGTNPSQWKEYCEQLLAEIQRLQTFNDMLRQQRRELLDALVPDRHRKIEFDEDEVLARVGQEPTLHQLLEELRQQYR